MKAEKLFKYIVIIVITYYVLTYLARSLHRGGPPGLIKYDPYLDRVDGVYGRARPGPIPQPYPNLYAPGPKVPFDSPGWILSNNGNPGYI